MGWGRRAPITLDSIPETHPADRRHRDGLGGTSPSAEETSHHRLGLSIRPKAARTMPAAIWRCRK